MADDGDVLRVSLGDAMQDILFNIYLHGPIMQTAKLKRRL